MPQPTLCLIFESIGDRSGIGRVAFLDVVTALKAGYRVTVVAEHLDTRLRNDVEWLRLYVPPRFFLLKWASARRYMRAAIGGRRFDLVHAHQPQAASMSDVFTCHFLTRVAHERNCLERRTSLRGRFIRLQQQGVLYLEDRCYRNWNNNTRMIFCSELLRDEFNRLYRPPPLQTVIDNACPPMRLPSRDARNKARAEWIGNATNAPVIGYLGGVDERKGFSRLLEAVRKDANVFLLIGGLLTEALSIPELAGRAKTCGIVRDVDSFYAACDVMAVPSVFDPSPMVVLESISRGVPVIATAGVGNLKHLLRTGAGAEWTEAELLGNIARDMVAHRERYLTGGAKMVEELSEERRAVRLLETYSLSLAAHGATGN